MSQLEIWNNPLLTMDLRLEVAVAEVEKLRQQLTTVTAERNEAAKPVAWMYTSRLAGNERFITRYQSELEMYKADKVWPLYTTPARKEIEECDTIRAELAAVTKELQAADDELNDFAECIAINRMYERQIADLREAVALAVELLDDYTDACGSELTGPYLSYAGQMKVKSIREALARTAPKEMK